MKIGLFFGSFNPIHVGHLILSTALLNETNLDEIWLVVSPQNPLKAQASLLDAYSRLEMVYLAVKNHPKIKPTNIEFNLPKPSYTIETLTHLKEKFPEKEFCLIMGADNLQNLHKWKNYEVLLENYKIYSYPRIVAKQTNLLEHKNIIKVENVPIIEISSSLIRKLIKEKKHYSAFLTPEVFNYIEKGNYYG